MRRPGPRAPSRVNAPQVRGYNPNEIQPVRNTILGISAFYHDSAAALLIDGEIAAAAHEERFTRRKHDSSFPVNAARYVLEEGGVNYKDLTAVAFYDKPFLKFERLLETYHGFSPRGLVSFQSAIPVWIKEKLFMRKLLKEQLAALGDGRYQHIIPSTIYLMPRALSIRRHSRKLPLSRSTG